MKAINRGSVGLAKSGANMVAHKDASARMFRTTKYESLRGINWTYPRINSTNDPERNQWWAANATVWIDNDPILFANCGVVEWARFLTPRCWSRCHTT